MEKKNNWPLGEAQKKVIEYMKENGGQAKFMELVYTLNVTIPRTWMILLALMRRGIIEKAGRGLYILKDGKI